MDGGKTERNAIRRSASDGAMQTATMSSRRDVLACAAASGIGLGTLLLTRSASAFGDAGAFNPRALLTGDMRAAAHPNAAPRWSREVAARTSAPARAEPTTVRADSAALLTEPFAWWSGERELTGLTDTEIRNLRRFFALGGMLVVDDAKVSDEGELGPFGRAARRELGRVLPGAAAVSLGAEHVLFRSFYILRRPEGRVQGKRTLNAIVRNGDAQVIFLQHDLGGALAYSPSRGWEETLVPNSANQREQAIRLAVNLAMYALCTNYKDDQVHAPFLMRRRASFSNDEP
jgi:Domain of unknown function (DUF4159)